MSYNLIQVLKDLLSGNISFANKQLAKDRTNICLSCEVRNTKLNTCTLCGCFLPFKTKLKKSNCPMGLW